MGDQHEPVQMYRKLWSGLAPGSNLDKKIAGNKEKVNSRHRSLLDRHKNLEKVKKIIRTRLGRKAQRKYTRNPVSLRRPLSARKVSSAKSSELRPRKPWYSDGYPELRAANENYKNKAKQLKDEDASSVTTIQRRKSIYFDDDGDEVPYYRSKSVTSSCRPDGTFTPVTNEQDVIYKTYTGRNIRTPVPRRPSSLPGKRVRRNTTPVHSKINQTPPLKRRSHSIGRLQKDGFKSANKIYAESDTDIRLQHQSQDSSLQMQHNRIRHLKLDPGEKARLVEAYTNLERIRQLNTNMKDEVKKQYFGKSNNYVNTMDSKFDKPRKSHSSETPVYSKNRPYTNMKLDPIEKRDDQPRRRRSTSKNGIPVAKINSKIGNRDGFRMGEVDHSTDTGTESSTIDTLSTAVMVNNDSPGPHTVHDLNLPRRPSVKGKQAKQSRPIRRKDSNNGMKSTTALSSRNKEESCVDKEEPLHNIISKRQLPPGGTAETTRRISKEIDSSLKSIDDGRTHTASPEEVSRSTTETTQENITTHISKVIVSPRKSSNTDPIHVYSTGQADDIRSDTGLHKSHTSERHSSNQAIADIAVKSKDTEEPQSTYLTRTTETTVTHSVKYLTNSGRENESNVDSQNNCENVNEIIIGKQGNPQINDSDDVHQEHASKHYIVDTANETSLETNLRRPSVTKRRLSKNVTSFDVVVDRHEYERKGHKVAEETIRNSISPRKAYTEKGQDEKVSVQETEEETEITHTIPGTQFGTVYGHIDWKAVAEQSQRDGKPQVLTVVKKTVHETETEDDVVVDTSGKHQWRDLVQKYLKQPNPKIGKSADRTLLEIPDDDDDDDVDIFERAKKKYQLDFDSENSED